MMFIAKRVISITLILSTIVLICGGCGKVKNNKKTNNVVSECYSIPNVQQKTTIDSGKNFSFTSNCNIVFNSNELNRYANTFAEDLKLLTTFNIKIKESSDYKSGDIYLELDYDYAIEDEGYILEIREDVVVVKGKTKEGIFYGTRTLLQWLKQGYLLPEADVTDYPAYKERSSLLDVARKYFSLEYIKNHIREISYLKYNYLYLHLTDNEGFRLECESYPEIVAEKHYTKKEIKEIVDFAAKYNIIVIPEIEMPGHMAGVLNVHTNWQLADKDGNKNATRLDITNPEVLSFIDNIIDEYITLFPGKYFHIGADEYIPVNEYINYPILNVYAKEKYGNNAKPVDVYYGFVNFVNDIIKKHGKITRMWNDGLGSKGTIEVSNDIVVDVWYTNSGTYSAKQLVKKGFTIGNSNTSKLYYVLGIDWACAKPDDLYENFEPNIFVNNEILEGEPNNLGAKMQLWCDNPDAETEEELYTSLECIYRALSQKNWGSKRIVEAYDDFMVIMNKVGSAPGYTFNEINLKIYKEITPIAVSPTNEYREINLGQIYYVNEVEMKLGENIIQPKDVQVSTDGINYTKAPGNGRFVRVFGDKMIASDHKITVYGKLLPDNIALNKEVTVSTEYDKKIWPASFAVDGQLSTRWASFDSAHSKGVEWITVDLGDVYDINGVAIYWETASAKAYDIEVSTDGNAWTKIHDKQNAEGGTEVIEAYGKGRYIKITTKDFNTPYGISIFEIKVFGYR